MKLTLKSFILDHLMASKIISYSEMVELANSYRAKTSSVERLFRDKNGNSLPVLKLNYDKKVCKEGETIYYYKYIGGSVWKKSQSKKSLKKSKK